MNYSTIVATLPEPTVRPPSRRQWIIIFVFPFDKYAFYGIFSTFLFSIILFFKIIRTFLELSVLTHP